MLTPRPTSRPAPVPGRREGFLVVVGTFAAFTYLFLANSWVGDDAYIMFRVVDNFVNGYGLRWNVANRVQAYTHPLWMLVMTGVTDEKTLKASPIRPDHVFASITGLEGLL